MTTKTSSATAQVSSAPGPTPVVLIVETPQAYLGVRFASADEAREWEDANPDVYGVQIVPLVTRAEAKQETSAWQAVL